MADADKKWNYTDIFLNELCQKNSTTLWNYSDCSTTTENETEILGHTPPYHLWQQILIGTLLAVLVLGTIVGNSLVCIAIAIVRKLQNPSNMLIVSLAVSDLLVGTCVMPFTIYYELQGVWLLGPIACDIYTSLDVMLCTASILNLCAISVDRYLVITRPFGYASKRSPGRMCCMIFCVWLTAAVISIPPMFGWKSPFEVGVCLISQDIGYQIYATFGAFYLPLIVMLVVYHRIYKVSSRLTKRDHRQQGGSVVHGLAANAQSTEDSSGQSFTSRSQESNIGDHVNLKEPNHNLPYRTVNDPQGVLIPNHMSFIKIKAPIGNRQSNSKKALSHKNRTEHHPLAHERKVTKTLGVILGGFVVCWLPFFILAVIRPFCVAPSTGIVCLSQWLTSIFQWLGYANSLLNPLIYARFNRDFRTPFREILCFRCIGINTRIRNKSYMDEYVGRRLSLIRDGLLQKNKRSRTIVKFNRNGHVSTLLDESGVNNHHD